MCGLVFTIHRDSMAYHLDDFFGDAMLASQVRGVDAAGLFQVDKDGSLFMKKKATSASEFLKDTQVQRIIRDANKCPLTVGHVRHATVGDKDNDANAHPFVFERTDKSRVVGVHNGTLKGWRDKKGGEAENVDSAWAVGMLANEGIDAFTHFNGPFAFIWWDSREPEHVWIARNDERTLFYYVSPNGKAIMGCSELGMLGWLTAKHGYGKHRNGDSGLHYFESGKIYKLSISNIGQIKSYDMPKYDPETTVKKESEPLQSAVNYFPASGNPNVQESGNSAAAPFTLQPNANGQFELRQTGRFPITTTGLASSTIRGNTRTSTRDIYPTIVKAKLALRKARDRRLGRSGYIPTEDPVVTTEDLDERMDSGMQKALNFAASKRKIDPWSFVDRDVRVASPNDRNAGAREITTAVYNKVYGRVVSLMGVDFDEDTFELLGEAYVQDEAGAQTTIDCVLRGMTKKLAHDVYINGPEPVPVVIVGEIEPKGLEPPMYVVANLEFKNRIEILRKDMRDEVDAVLA